jgi:hypothetical protein
MALHGSSVPIFANPADKPMAVMVICPNEYSHKRLMQFMAEIVPEAGVPTPQPVTSYIAGFEPNEDGVIVPGCANGSCGLD